MNCSTCKNNVKGTPKGCRGNGNCLTNGCSQRTVYNWLSNLDNDSKKFNKWVELSFKNGRKKFVSNNQKIAIQTGDVVVIELAYGIDMGMVSLTGHLVEFQMDRKNAEKQLKDAPAILRKATEKDIKNWKIVREKESDYILKARELVKEIALEMKISDAELQADGNKVTFYYTAEDRVDFRELLKKMSLHFSLKIEMKQIGSRQESSRLGGIGSCGRELCCSTWMKDFRSVTTKAARYQQLSLNPQKLAGQCGKLKCCLNFELDQYVEMINTFPSPKRKLISLSEKGVHIKTDVFRKMMWYSIKNQETKFITIESFSVDEVRALHERMDKGEKIHSLLKVNEETSFNQNKSSDLSDDINRFNNVFKRKKRTKQKWR